MTKNQQAVLSMFNTFGAMNDKDLVSRYKHQKYVPFQSVSGIRTRRRELVDAGLLKDTGHREYTEYSTRRSIVWGIA